MDPEYAADRQVWWGPAQRTQRGFRHPDDYAHLVSADPAPLQDYCMALALRAPISRLLRYPLDAGAGNWCTCTSRCGNGIEMPSASNRCFTDFMTSQ